MLSELRAHTLAVIRKYLQFFPDSQLDRLVAQLRAAEDCFARSNMDGHVTTSAAVLNPSMDKLLMIHHIHHQKWLPPGGHYEGPESLWDSAVREVEEETGVMNPQLHPWCAEHGIPVSISSHPVTARPSKGESAHWHHDFRFLAIAEEVELTPQLNEVHGARWVPLKELLQAESPSTAALAKRIVKIVSGRGIKQLESAQLSA